MKSWYIDSNMKNYEESTFINIPINEIFGFADNPAHFSSHMNKSSWMMGGSKMVTETDVGKGQKVGSHIKMTGNMFGIHLFLDEVVTHHEPPYHKEWQTMGSINLLVIDHYKLGFEIKPEKGGSHFKVYIYYDLPKSLKTRWLGMLLGDIYAKWCVRQMIKGVENYFN